MPPQPYPQLPPQPQAPAGQQPQLPPQMPAPRPPAANPYLQPGPYSQPLMPQPSVTPGFPGQYPPLGPPGGFPPGFPQPPRRSNKRAVAVISMVLASVLIAGVSLIVGFSLTGQSAPIDEAKIPAPGPGEDPSEEYVKEKSEVLLDQSAEGLLKGNEGEWLSVFDSAIHDDMTQRYASLRALQVSAFDYQVIGDPDSHGSKWDVEIGVNYCLGGKKGKKCAPSGMIFETEWTYRDDQLLATKVEESDTKPDGKSQFTIGARPWEVEELQAKAGDRAVVAATADAADDYDIDDTLKLAEEAAENADKYAEFGKVDKYVVFMGSDQEIADWYGLGSSVPQSAIGFALPLPQLDKKGEPEPGGSEVVLFAERLKKIEDDYGDEGAKEFESTVRHELGHVATLHHSPEHTPSDLDADWWVSEGIAELIDHKPDASLDGYARESGTKKFLKSDDWKGELTAPTGADQWGSAKYGVAFYWSYYLYNEYGKEKFMDFFERVARNGDSPEDASKEAFGESYEDITDDCKKFTKDKVL